MPVSEGLYREIALEDPTGRWERICGELTQRGPMTTEHNRIVGDLDHQLQRQIDPRRGLCGRVTVGCGVRTASTSFPTYT